MTAEKSKIFKETLENGLTLIAEPNPANKSCAIGFFVRTGARDETSSESGISHFLEHMMFKGTQKRSAMDITFELGSIGAQANAYTSEENTVYYAGVIPEYFASMQELLSDMLRPALIEEEFDTEKKVILEEIALYQDRPHFYLFEKALGDFFGGHSAGNSVLGSTESVSAISRQQMQNYFDRRYLASNITLIASGDFDYERFRSDALRYCGDWSGGEVTRDLSEFSGNSIKRVYPKKNLNQSHVLFICNSCSAQDTERYALSVLSTILGDSSGSKLYWDLIDKGLVDSAGTDLDEKDAAGCFMAYAGTEPERFEQVRDILFEAISHPLDFSDQDLERAKTKTLSRIILDGEMPMGRMMALGAEWVYRGRLHHLQDEAESIRSLTRRDIEKALEKFPLKGWSEFHLIQE